MHYIKFKKNKVGICNICRAEKNLSWDHVPPKGGISLTKVEIESIFQVLTSSQDDNFFQESQNGVKFRSICKDCNSKLNELYDKELNEFSLSVGRYLKSTLSFPEIIHHKTKPINIIRGILGHLLSAKIELDETIFDKQIRRIIFDVNEKLPDDLHVFYWIYPFDKTVIIRDISMPAIRGNFKKYGYFQIIKYFPLAYLIGNVPRYEGLYELTIYKDININEELEIPIRLDTIKHHEWPEIVDNHNILFFGESGLNSVFAKPKTKIIR